MTLVCLPSKMLKAMGISHNLICSVHHSFRRSMIPAICVFTVSHCPKLKGIVRVVSRHQAKGLDKTNEKEDCFQHAAPLNSPDLKLWLENIPFSATAVICESDFELDHAEHLADAIEKAQQQQQKSKTVKNNGCNSAQQDKFPMNPSCEERGWLLQTMTLALKCCTLQHFDVRVLCEVQWETIVHKITILSCLALCVMQHSCEKFILPLSHCQCSGFVEG